MCVTEKERTPTSRDDLALLATHFSDLRSIDGHVSTGRSNLSRNHQLVTKFLQPCSCKDLANET
jgi:hypothetical protein